jgi:hypothetical protein
MNKVILGVVMSLFVSVSLSYAQTADELKEIRQQKKAEMKEAHAHKKASLTI